MQAMNPSSFFILCSLLAIAVCFLILYITRDIVCEGQNSDGHKHIHAASRVHEWVWISDMHKYAGQKAWFKDVGVLGLVLLQRLFRDKTSYYPVVAMCTLANAGSAILLYLVAFNYWGAPTALIVTLLYIFCFWPYQVLIQGGYQVIALFFFLTSIYCFQVSARWGSPYHLIYFSLGGITSGLMMFASASARKFTPVLVVAWVYSLSPWAQIPASVGDASRAIGSGAGFIFLFGALLTSICRPWVYRLSNRTIQRLYTGPGFDGIRRALIKHEDRFSFEHYQQRGRQYLASLMNLVFVGMLYGALCRAFSGTSTFYVAQLSTVIGFIVVFILLMSPRFISNLKGLFTYWTISQWGGHFRSYTNYFAKRGMVFKEDMRGIGWGWYPRFVWRIIPFHMVFALILFVGLAYLSFIRGQFLSEMGKSFLILAIGLSPWIYGEITGCTQFARTYFPGLAGVLLCIGYGCWRIASWIPSQHQPLYWQMWGIMILASTLWNTWVFFSDVWPGRMAPTWLLKYLQKSGIHEIYSYDTCYNNSLLRALDPQAMASIKVNWIKSLNDVRSGFVVIPCTSSKSVALESDRPAIEQGDFREDPLLNELIDTRKIKKYALGSFKTVGCSRMWVQEGEVPSYRDLILKEIGSEDRWRGHAWILDAGKYHHEHKSFTP